MKNVKNIRVIIYQHNLDGMVLSNYFKRSWPEEKESHLKRAGQVLYEVPDLSYRYLLSLESIGSTEAL